MMSGNCLFTCINQLPAAVLRLSAIGNTSEVGFTQKVSWEYNSATTMLKCVSSFPICCAFIQLLVCITKFVWRWEVHRNTSIQPFSSGLLEIKAMYGLQRVEMRNWYFLSLAKLFCVKAKICAVFLCTTEISHDKALKSVSSLVFTDPQIHQWCQSWEGGAFNTCF